MSKTLNIDSKSILETLLAEKSKDVEASAASKEADAPKVCEHCGAPESAWAAAGGDGE